MIRLYRTLYSPFPLAVLMSGLTLGLASNLMTDVFRTHPLDLARLISAGLFFVSALSFSMLYAEFAKIEANSQALISSGGGIPRRDNLVEDMLHTGRKLLLFALGCGVVAFLLGISVSSGLVALLNSQPETQSTVAPVATTSTPPAESPRSVSRIQLRESP